MKNGLLFNRLEFADVEAEQFKEVLDRANFEHTIIAGQRGNAVVEQIHGPAFSIDYGRYAFPFAARGHFAPRCICIGIVQWERVPTWINGFSTGRGNLQFYNEGADILYRAGSHGSWTGLTLTRDRLQAEARKRLGRELRIPGESGMEHLRIDPEAWDRIWRLIRSLRPNRGSFSVFRNPEALSGMIIGAYVEAIATADQSTAEIVRQRAGYRFAVVRSADTMMRSLIGSAYSSNQLCKALGLSERSLELHFQEALGVSPRAWFHYLALHRARAELRHRPCTKSIVTEVALDCGFTHLGRFSKSYRDLFGELPSATSSIIENESKPRRPMTVFLS